MQAISRWNSEIFNPRRQVHILELPDCAGRNVRREPSGAAFQEEVLRALVREGLDHARNVPRHVTRVNDEVQ